MFHVLSLKRYSHRVRSNSVFFVTIFFYLVSNSHASSISNFGEWRNLHSVSKTAYTAGLLDTFINPLEPQLEHDAFVKKLDSCLKKLHITVIEVVRMIDYFYLNSENWGLKPQDVVRLQLINGRCLPFFR